LTGRRFSRVRDFLSDEGFLRVRNSWVTVVGLGGVGCHSAIALARSGIGGLTLVDFDQLTETSLNRNPVAGPGDVGALKVEVMTRHLKATCPDTVLKTIPLFYHEENADEILNSKADAVIDAIDSLNPKTSLLQQCVKRGIPVFSSMGASGRSDPSLVRTGDLFNSRGCPLAKQVRKYLRKRDVFQGISCVYSIEPAGDHARHLRLRPGGTGSGSSQEQSLRAKTYI